MATKRHSRQVGIVHVLRSREWVSANSLARRFEVVPRTIYRDIEELIAAGVPIESVSGPEGGYRLASDQPLTPLTLSADEALKLYVVSLLDRRKSNELDSDVPELGNTYSREAPWAQTAQPAHLLRHCRLVLEPKSEVEHTANGGLVIRLYVDRWEWLIPLVTSYGGDVLIEEPAELRDAYRGAPSSGA